MNQQSIRGVPWLRLALVAGLVAVAGFVWADFNSKGARKAGFAAKDGQFDGKGLSDAEKAKVQGAIDKLKGNAGGASAECEKGLQDMLDKHRICKEGGTSGSGATTLPDGKTGLGGDGINVNPKSIDADPEVLACMLAHEWVHVNQTGPPYDEKEAYAAEKKCLEDLGKAGSARHKQMTCCLESLEGRKKKDAETPRARLGQNRTLGPESREAVIAPIPFQPYTGFADLIVGSSVFMVNEADLGLQSYPINSWAPFNVFPLNMLEPLNLLLLEGVAGPAGGPVLAISGALGADGVIDFVEIDPRNGVGVQNLGSVLLPGCRPLSLSDEVFQGLHLLYVLDSQNRRVQLLFDGDGDGLPEAVFPSPWATSATFSALTNAKAIRRNSGQPLSVLVSPRDLRVENTVHLNKPMVALYDTNGDALADATQGFVERELYAVVPWYYHAPAAGDTQITAFCTSGDRIELWQSNAAGTPLVLLGTQVCGTNNQAVYPVAPLVSGQYYQLKDITFLFGDSPVPFLIP